MIPVTSLYKVYPGWSECMSARALRLIGKPKFGREKCKCSASTFSRGEPFARNSFQIEGISGRLDWGPGEARRDFLKMHIDQKTHAHTTKLVSSELAGSETYHIV